MKNNINTNELWYGSCTYDWVIQFCDDYIHFRRTVHENESLVVNTFFTPILSAYGIFLGLRIHIYMSLFQIKHRLCVCSAYTPRPKQTDDASSVTHLESMRSQPIDVGYIGIRGLLLLNVHTHIPVGTFNPFGAHNPTH